MEDVYKRLEEANQHTAKLSELFRGIRDIEKNEGDEKKEEKTRLVVAQRQNNPFTSDLVENNEHDQFRDSSYNSVSKYIPTKINEKFQYTVIPKSKNGFYNAKVVSVEHKFINIVHIGTRDSKYGYDRINIDNTEFRPHRPLATGKNSKRKKKDTKRPTSMQKDKDNEAYIPPSTMIQPGNNERMHFVLNRPPSRRSAVDCMMRLGKFALMDTVSDYAQMEEGGRVAL